MIIDGSAIAEKKLKELAKLIQGHPLHLVAVLMGDDPWTKKFVKIKKKAAESIGITFSSYEFSLETSETEILKTIGYLNNDPDTQGIFVELPVPVAYDQQKIINAIIPTKDVDVLTDVLQKKFYAGDFLILPPAVRALEIIFREYDIEPKGKKIAVFGQGFLIGKPASFWLERRGADISVINIDTKNPERISLAADIIISGVGKADLITGDMVKDNAVVIDFGYPADIDFEEVNKKASLITPTPDGTGPLVVAAVLENLANMAK